MKRYMRWILPAILIGAVAGAAEINGAKVPTRGLIAYFPMQEGQGTVVRDATKQQPDGRIVRSFWTRRDNLDLVDFGGMTSSREAYINLGKKYDLSKGFTLSFWVSAYHWENNFAGLVYQSDATCGVRNYRNHPGQLHFRIKGKGEKRGIDMLSDTVLERGTWYHVAAAYAPSKAMSLYIDGVLDRENRLNIPAELNRDDKPLTVGGPGKGNYFSGTIANLRIYDRALTPGEVAAIFRAENIFRHDPVPVTAAQDRAPEAARIGALVARATGGMELRLNGETFTFESRYSYPAKPRMNFHALGLGRASDAAPEWQVAVKQLSPESFQMEAGDGKLKIVRTVKLEQPGLYRVRETLHNLSTEDRAVVFYHTLSLDKKPAKWFLYGVENAASAADSRLASANPTLFLIGDKSALGFVAEDDIFRCLLDTEVRRGRPDWSFMPGSRRLGIAAGKAHTLEYTLDTRYRDYFDFLNALRNRWQVPEVFINGPLGGALRIAGSSSSVYRKELAPDPERFKAYFKRRNFRMVTLNPWWNYWDGRLYPDRAAFKKAMREAMKTVRAVNPEMKFFASLETYTYCLGREALPDLPEKFDWSDRKAATRIVLATPWRDSVDIDGSGLIEFYPMRQEEGAQPGLNVMVYPAPGGKLDKTRMEEFDFLLDEVGFDGIYQDMFGFSAPSDLIKGRWDGFTVRAAQDGTIAERFTHKAPFTAPARAAWLRYILGKGKLALTNFGAPTTRDMQTIPYMNFAECAGRGVGHQDLDAIPPDASGCAMNQLSTPLAYGPHKKEEINAEQVMKRVRAYLRYGVLYVHTSVRNYFPSEGPGSGEYGPINHMYPITPLELHRGWVKGKERIVSCVSYSTVWERQAKPVALRFDAVGRDKEVGDAVKIAGKPGAWEITVKIDDWKEFLVLE